MSLWSGELPEVDELNAFLAISAGGSSLGRGDSTLHWILQTERYFCFLTFWKTASGSSGSSAFVWRKHSTEGASWGCLAVHWGQQSHRMVQHFFFFFFLSLLLFPCGWVLFCFCFVSLTKEKLLLGQRAGGCPAPGWGPSYECKTEITSEGGCPECWPCLTDRGRPWV